MFSRFSISVRVTIAILIAGLLASTEAGADGALAIGVLRKNRTSYSVWGVSIGHNDTESAQSAALEQCRAQNSPATDACKIAETFRDKCSGVSVNGANSRAGLGWSVSETVRQAAYEAMSKCRSTASNCGFAAMCDGAAVTVDNLNDLITLAPNNAGFHLSRGILFKNKGDIDHAMADFGEVIRIDSKRDEAYSRRADVYSDKGDFDHAIDGISEAIKIDPNNAGYYGSRGYYWLRQEELDRALADFDQSLSLNPKQAASLYNRALINSFREGKVDDAIADLTEAMELDPKAGDYPRARGRAYRFKGDLDRAIADLDAAISLNPRSIDAYNNRARAYEARQDWPHALADYTEAIRRDPKAANSYLNRGRLLFGSGDTPKALADFSQASELNPTSPYIALWLDIAFARSRLPSRLADATVRLDMTNWPAPIVRFYLGQLTAEALFAAADNADPKTKSEQRCEANFYGGEYALRGGKKPDALRLLRSAASACAKSSSEHDGAVAELKLLGEQP